MDKRGEDARRRHRASITSTTKISRPPTAKGYPTMRQTCQPEAKNERGTRGAETESAQTPGGFRLQTTACAEEADTRVAITLGDQL